MEVKKDLEVFPDEEMEKESSSGEEAIEEYVDA